MNKETRNNGNSTGVSTGFSNEISSGTSTGSEGTSAGTDKKSLNRKGKNALLIAGGILGAAALVAAGVGISEKVENGGNYSELGRSGGIHTIKAGERFEAPADSIINGDVMIKVNGKLERLFDNAQGTGAQIITSVPLTGYAPVFEGKVGGATIETNIKPELIEEIAQQDRKETEKKTGIKAENIEVLRFPETK